MSQRSEQDDRLKREIRQSRKFSTKEAVARLAGPGAMKGASPISRLEQAESEIANWLGGNLADTGGILRVVLQRNLNGSEMLLDNLDRPLIALAGYLQYVRTSSQLLDEIVREADVEWGRQMDERPYFQKQGQDPHPEDPYTTQSVDCILTQALLRLADPTGH